MTGAGRLEIRRPVTGRPGLQKVGLLGPLVHTVLNMSKHYNQILELELRLSEELGEKTFVVPHVSIFIYSTERNLSFAR